MDGIGQATSRCTPIQDCGAQKRVQSTFMRMSMTSDGLGCPSADGRLLHLR